VGVSPSITAPAGIGMLTRSLSFSYPSGPIRIGTRGTLESTTLIGMPYSAPSVTGLPKPGCSRPFPRATSRPMIASELAATGASAIRWFQGLSSGKTC